MGNGNQNGNHSNNGHHPNVSVNPNGNGGTDVSSHDLLWDGLPPAVVNALQQPLDPALVSQRKGRGNRRYDYIEGHTVIDQANRIFGYGGWGYELAGEVSLRHIENIDARTGEIQVSFAFSAPVRVTVAGALPRADIGFHPVTDDTAEGYETAAKGAVTDGLKRALRSFGDQFGNCLYGDQPQGNSRPRTQRTEPGANTNGNARQDKVDDRNGERDASYFRQLRGRLIALGAEQGFDEDRVREAVKKQTGRELDDLPADDLKPLVENAARKVNEAKAAEGNKSNGNG